jgi:hypothetical protein
VVEPDQTIQVRFEIVNGNPVDGAFFNLGGTSHRLDGSGLFVFDLTAPDNIGGRVDIAARTFGPGPEHYSASTHIIVEPSATPSGIGAVPKHLSMVIGDRVQLRVLAGFSSGSSLDITSAGAGTSYSILSGDGDVITVDADGLVTAHGVGQDIVVVQNAGLWTQTTVEVSIYTRPIFWDSFESGDTTAWSSSPIAPPDPASG